MRGGRVDRLAILSFALATAWLFGVGSLLALYVGRLSLRRLKVDRDVRGGTVAWAGIAVAIFGIPWAGLALGLPMWKVLFYILGPVAFRRMIPPLGNQFIVSLKDTSLFIVIGVGELTRQGQEIMAANFRAVEIWSAVAILYLMMTGTLTLILRVTEKRMRIL